MESLHEQIVVALKAHLEGTPGWYPPDRVVRQPSFHRGCLDDGLTTIYVLVPGQPTETLAHSSIGKRAIVPIDLGIATKHTPSSEDPFGADEPLRWTVQTRLEQDAKARIASNYKLGLASIGLYIEMPFTEYAAEETFIQGWAVVFIRCLIHYVYLDTAP